MGEAAYRNRTDDLRITRSAQPVHRHPLCHPRPACWAPDSTQVHGRPRSLLADLLARSPIVSAGSVSRGHPDRFRRAQPVGRELIVLHWT